MKSTKWLSMLLCCALLACVSATAAFAEPTPDVLTRLGGSYVELFPVLTAPEYDATWLSACTQYGGAETAEASAQMLKNVCMGQLYGEEAVAAFAGKEEMTFNCFFTGGVAQFTVDGNTISGVDKDGATVFRHAYQYVGQNAEMGMDMAVYESVDADSGEFTYFLFAPDVPDETFHIEFRYGDDLAALTQMMTGKYAYWLAAGIPAVNPADYAGKAIDLFCKENLAQHEETEATPAPQQ